MKFDDSLKSNYPLVTVFTLIYNTNPKFVIEAIESVRANNYPNIQHIIIDDCSPDPEPKRVVKEWIRNEKYCCEFYEHEVNYGLCKTLNHVLQLAKGKYILGCSDDVIDKNRIGSQKRKFDELDNSFALIYSDMLVIDSNSNNISNSYMNFSRISIHDIKEFEKLKSTEQIRFLLLYKNIIMSPSVMYRTEALRQVGGFDEKLYFEDLDMNSRLLNAGYKFKFCDEKNTSYRILSDSMSKTINENYIHSHNLIFLKFIGLNQSFDKELFRQLKNNTFDLTVFSGSKKYFWLFRIILRKFDLIFLWIFIIRMLKNEFFKWKRTF